jgi:preprotein translocase subunit YajC
VTIKLALLTTAALALTSAPALAQSAPESTATTPAASSAAPATATVTAGAQVFDQTGGTVGRIDTVEGQFAVLATDKSKVRLPLTSFAKGDKGLVIGMTKDQIDAAASGAAASAQQDPTKLVTVGATVKDTAGGTVGTVKQVDSQYALIATGKNEVRLPITAFGAGTDGPVIAMTAAQLDQAAAAAGGGKQPAPQSN